MSLVKRDLGRAKTGLARELIAPCVSGSMKIYDAHGIPHTIESLLTDTTKFNAEEMYTWSLNEKTNKLEKTRVRAVVRQTDKKNMLRIKTSHTSIEVTEDHKLMVNRDGDLIWIQSKDIVKGDLLMAPKFFFRSKKECNWKDAITVKYESFPGESPRPYGLAAKVGNEWQSLHLPSGFNLCLLYYIVGMLDGGGWIDTENGVTHYATDDFYSLLSFSANISDLFMLEPEISGDKKSGYFADTTNKIAADILSYALEHLFQQEDEIIAHYLSGFIDSSGRITAYDKSPTIYFDTNDPNKRERLKKTLHVFGILAPKETRSHLAIAAFCDIEALAAVLDTRLESIADLMSDMIRNNIGAENKSVGFRLGKKLLDERKLLNLSKTDLGFTSAKMTRFEKDGLVSFGEAWSIAEKLQSKVSPSGRSKASKTTVAELVSSDLIGIKVTSIEDMGLEWAYDLACENNHNFFVNDILCHDCVL